MEKKGLFQKLLNERWFGFIALGIAFFGFILQSPKFGYAIFAWITPLSLLFYSRISPVKRKILWMFLVLWLSGIAASKDVAPFPLPVLVVIALIDGLKQLIPFMLDRWVSKRTNHFVSTLVFPALFTVREFIDGGMGAGVWNSIANTQYPFSWLTQLASVTGLWGISFVIAWFASVVVWAIQRAQANNNYRRGLTTYAIVLGSILVFGAFRINLAADTSESKVKVAGVTVPIFPFMEALYQDYSGKTIHVDPKLSQSSPELQKINLALIPFIENADTLKFKKGFAALGHVHDSLFSLSAKAAGQDAKIISWSEGNAMVFRKDEGRLIERGREFAATHQVYFLMAIASVEPGKITPGKKFVENKTIFFGPDGKILNVFHKNKPVPLVENSEPGDGSIPVIPTTYGNVAVSICYDADFPKHMQQLGKKKAGLLLLPSGDWFAISPYHSQMARMRAIENGTALFRQVSGGLSLATDNKGRILAQKNFFDEGEKILISEVPISNTSTVYSIIGNALVYGCFLIGLASIIFLLLGVKKKKIVQNIDTAPVIAVQ